MKKGFTLIELLAVIVILAIIALIATPIILGIINNAKEESDKRSVELYVKAAELAVARENLKGEFKPTTCTVEGGVCMCEGYTDPLNVEMDNASNISGNITFNEKGVVTSNTLEVLHGGTTEDPTPEEEPEEEPEDEGKYIYIETPWKPFNVNIGPSLGSTITPTSWSEKPSDIVYLKYQYDDSNVVTSMFNCAVMNGKEYCISSAEPLGDDTTGAIGYLKSISNEEGITCTFETGWPYPSCTDGAAYLGYRESGIVFDGEYTGECFIDEEGCGIGGW